MKPVCPECGDSGYRLSAESGVARAVRCGCERSARRERLLAAARLPRRYEHCDLADFDELTEGLRKARRLALDWIQNYPEVEGGLMFLGPPGAGKTHLAVAILRLLVAEKGARGLFCDFRELLKTIQGTYNPASQASELSVLQPVVEAELLVLDDLGSGRPTGWVQETLFYILTSRYNERRTTIVTSNLPDGPADRMQKRETLEAVIGTALRSRLAEMCRVVPLHDAKDYRIEIRRRTDLHPL